MQILEEKNNEFKLKIDSLDDLWILTEFINPNDIIYSTTSRKVRINENKQVTKIIFVELLVKKTKFENLTLRISGEIQNETEFTAIGQSQTLSFKINDNIKIKKNSLLEYEKKLLENSIKSKNNSSLLILMDKDELILSEFNNYNYRIILHKKGLGNKKYFKTEINENEEKFKLIEEYLNRNYSNIIISGTGVYKSNFQKYLKSKTYKKTILFHSTDISPNSIPKLIEKISKDGILEENQLANETKLINELLKNISLEKKYSYGENETINNINIGSIKDLLVTTKFIEDKKENGTYSEFNKLIRLVEQTRGKFHIINSNNEAGRILDGLGGIGGILRY